MGRAPRRCRLCRLSGLGWQKGGVMPPLPAVLPGEVLLARRPDVQGHGPQGVVASGQGGLGQGRALPKFYLGLAPRPTACIPTMKPGRTSARRCWALACACPFRSGPHSSTHCSPGSPTAGLAIQYEQTVLGALEDVENVYAARRAFEDKAQRVRQASQLAGQIAQRKMALFQSGQELLQVALGRRPKPCKKKMRPFRPAPA